RVLVPELHIAGHWLVVKFHVVRDGAEEHMEQFVFASEEREFVLVPQNPVPAMSALVGVADVASVGPGVGMLGTRLVHEARLREAHAGRDRVPGDEPLERDLQAQRQLLVQLAWPRCAPEYERRGRR